MEMPINIFLAGDSTVQTYKKDELQGGWGEFLENHLPNEINVFNYAIGGRSSKTFIEEGRLHNMLKNMSKNDYLFIQMGHNDATKNRPERYTDPMTTYKDYILKYIDSARHISAIPILITPVARLNVEDGNYKNDFSEYCQALREVAGEKDVPLIDLMSESLLFYKTIGYGATFQLFMASINHTDFTHFTKKGANEIAKIVAKEFQLIMKKCN